MAGGEIRGRVQTDAGQEVGGQVVEIKLDFHVKQP